MSLKEMSFKCHDIPGYHCIICNGDDPTKERILTTVIMVVLFC